MARKRRRIEYLLGPLGAVATAVFFGAALFGVMASAVDAQKAPHRFISDRVAELATQQGINPVELAAIASYQVERVCFVLGAWYSLVKTAAELHGVNVDVPPDTHIPERSYATFVIGPNGEVTYGALHSSYFTAPSPIRCFEGGNLALQFDGVSPLSGGRLVDLDAPDLRPRMIEG